MSHSETTEAIRARLDKLRAEREAAEARYAYLMMAPSLRQSTNNNQGERA